MKKLIYCLIGSIVFFCFNLVVKADKILNLNEIADAFNNNPGILEMNKVSDEYNVSSNVEGNILKVTSKTQEEYVFEYVLNDNILSIDYGENEDKVFGAAIISMYVIDSVQHLQGYDYGEILPTITTLDPKEYTLINEGIEATETGVKLDIRKKIPLKDLKNIYFTIESLEDMKKYISGDGFVQNKLGNMFYHKSGYDGKNTLIVAEKDELTSNTYNSIISLITVMFEEEKVVTYFKNNYSSLNKDKVSFDGFVVEYEPVKTEDEEFMIGDSNYKFVRLTIDKEAAKNAALKVISNNRNEEIINPKTGIKNYIVFGICIIVVSIVSIIILNRKKKFI